MPNRLAAATSPYLLQHARNPVDWFAWGPDAFAEARRRGVPLLISVGYAACHWCHVMAHESFEDPAVAAAMNAGFVCVKVDREERPDVDAVYMAATIAMSGQGGWPMTVFATPEGEPFFAGTYFPPRPAHGRASFRQVLDAVSQAWTTRADEVRASAAVIRDHLRSATTDARPDDEPEPGAPAPSADTSADARAGTPAGASTSGPAPPVDPSTLDAVVRALARDADVVHGGFGGAPKFPPSMLLEWLLRRHARSGDAEALAMAERTLEAMALGGIYDQLGGGFARYSVDEAWVVPHFEKMLYDNALLLRVYLHAWRATGSPLARRVCQETAEWLVLRLRTPQGAFASSLDADSADGTGRLSEGAYYVWTPAQLVDALGAADGTWAEQVWGVTREGSFEAGTSVLTLRDGVPDDRARYADVRRRLRDARDRRAAPGRDDKVVAAWNGLAVAALAEAGALLGRDDWVDAAEAAADLLLRVHARPGGADQGARLVRTSRDGTAGDAPGVLEDYAHVANGLLVLYGVTGDERRVSAAGALLETVLDRFPDGRGTFYDTAADETDPVLDSLGRPQELADGPTPAGSAAAAEALLSYAALTGSARHRRRAERALGRLLPLATRVPRAAGHALAVGEALLDGPCEIAVVGPPQDPRTQALHRAALMATAPGAVVGLADPQRDPAPAVALVRDRALVDGAPAAYVCRDFVCLRPTTDPARLAGAR